MKVSNNIFLTDFFNILIGIKILINKNITEENVQKI